MEVYEVTLNDLQYSRLNKILNSDRSLKADLARNNMVSGYELFCVMVYEIFSPVTDGLSTLEVLMEEDREGFDLLRLITKQVFPEDEDYFVKQPGKRGKCLEFFADKDLAFRIYKESEEKVTVQLPIKCEDF